MDKSLVGLIKRATSQRKRRKQLFQKLRKKKPRELDKTFHELHEEAFEEIDCLSCGNCCKTISPVFTDQDISRISRHVKMRPADFTEEYLYEDDEADMVLKQTPCPFLGADNYCNIYEVRPRACRQYPHTDRQRMHRFLSLTHKNAEVCPAVAHIVDRMLQVS
ncbi:MAG: YkgJ family cysteine cluster protein [Bacteroidota bacterium]